jgi:hypothetical protein
MYLSQNTSLSSIGAAGLWAGITLAMVHSDRNQYRRCPGRKWGPPGDFAGMM